MTNPEADRDHWPQTVICRCCRNYCGKHEGRDGSFDPADGTVICRECWP